MLLKENFYEPGQGDALIVIDIQNDFLPGGALAVENGDTVIPVLNEYIRIFKMKHLPIVASRDWHPANHCSFSSQGGTWPPHCIENTEGAKFAKALNLPAVFIVVSKAMTPEKEAYSDLEGTDLGQLLRSIGVNRVWVGGLATDYCVFHSVIDFLKSGYKVLLLTEGIKAVSVHPKDGERAIDKMVSQGAVPITMTEVKR